MSRVLSGDGFSVGFTDREVTAWGGLALLKRMLDSMEFQQAVAGWGLPESGSNRGYPALQLVEQFIVSIWCGACRFAHAEVVRLDRTLTRLFGWKCAAEFKAIQRLFARFDMLANERVLAESYRWFFGKLASLSRLTLDLDSTVVTRNGEQEGASRGYNPAKHGRASHHPLLAFVAQARLVANFWLRPGNAASANNVLQFLESTLTHLAAQVQACCPPFIGAQMASVAALAHPANPVGPSRFNRCHAGRTSPQRLHCNRPHQVAIHPHEHPSSHRSRFRHRACSALRRFASNAGRHFVFGAVRHHALGR